MTDDELAADEAVIAEYIDGVWLKNPSDFGHITRRRWPAYIAEVKRLRAELDAAHKMIDNCFDVESREAIDADPNGLGTLERRIFHIWKRDPKVSELRAALAARDAALDEIRTWCRGLPQDAEEIRAIIERVRKEGCVTYALFSIPPWRL